MSPEELEEIREELAPLNLKELLELMKILRQVVFERSVGVE
jgi:hypothetical protein